MLSLRDDLKSGKNKNFGMPRKTAAFIVALSAYPLAHLLDRVTYRHVDRIMNMPEMEFFRHKGFDKYGRALIFMLAVLFVLRLACRWTPKLRNIFLGVFAFSALCAIVRTLFKHANPQYGLRGNRYFVDYGCRKFVMISGVLTVLAILIIHSTRRKRMKKYSKVSRIDNLILCSHCGADMSTSHDLCCVNCKTSYTLDELLAVNSRRKQAEKPKGGNDEA